MKTFDEDVLNTVYPTIELEAAIPKGVYDHPNPDGTRPKVRIIVTTENAPLRAVMGTLSQLDDDLEQLSEIGIGFGVEYMPEDERAKLNPDEDAEDAMKLFTYERPEWAEPVEMLEASGATADGSRWSLKIEIVAPSGRVLATAITHLCSDEMLNRTIAHLMPEDDEDDDL